MHIIAWHILLNCCTIYITTEIITRQEIFDYLKVWLLELDNSLATFLHDLTSCFFCTSCWMATGVYIYSSRPNIDIRVIFLYIAAVNLADGIIQKFSSEKKTSITPD